ncbi:hypothetical protein Caci_6619 [Catenulispora acidiphila DSM 44928]|uniref:Uncharacterized protein n=1 Tax=Catenulispora acidiphila (strain DSM 44928 / JCM 14897 / NBRC 102108 / NRRL B-24433 / ID139908) TaxID=479433 RepID=C7PZX2_CATAD|nr:hypothetical protein Caci_6619 [Catenulispora acidiphila DSM 44928]
MQKPPPRQDLNKDLDKDLDKDQVPRLDPPRAGFAPEDRAFLAAPL